ncbi:adult-specific rigid cuticular protein 15.7 [Caerostris extrusa]|uniref:Adult-specific rigid cuticular protein 15.7 n=1 Tax=Caerostris extrusa TaxID=172846 RepID=A0AAV4X1M3_CAEEX|nr:adult-specific rigid cuticular protein 15.7 [Caerostris extrusa]
MNSYDILLQVAFLCAALAAVRASGLIGAPLINTGISTSARQQDVSINRKSFKNFKFKSIGKQCFRLHHQGWFGATNSRSEVGDGYGNRKGSYTITDIDGRARRVDYVADGHGFRATVKTNEPEPPPALRLQPSSPAPTPAPSPPSSTT